MSDYRNVTVIRSGERTQVTPLPAAIVQACLRCGAPASHRVHVADADDADLRAFSVCAECVEFYR